MGTDVPEWHSGGSTCLLKAGGGSDLTLVVTVHLGELKNRSGELKGSSCYSIHDCCSPGDKTGNPWTGKCQARKEVDRANPGGIFSTFNLKCIFRAWGLSTMSEFKLLPLVHLQISKLFATFSGFTLFQYPRLLSCLGHFALSSPHSHRTSQIFPTYDVENPYRSLLRRAEECWKKYMMMRESTILQIHSIVTLSYSDPTAFLPSFELLTAELSLENNRQKSFRYNFVFLRNQILYRPIGLNAFPAQKRCLFGRQPYPEAANECCRVQGKRFKDRVGHIRFHNPRMQSHHCDIWILSSDIGLQLNNNKLGEAVARSGRHHHQR